MRYNFLIWWLIPIVFSIGQICADGNHADLFDSEVIESNSFSSTEGVLSSLIANHVSAITGEFVDQSTDCILAGPEPLILQRFYSSSPSIDMFGFHASPLRPLSTLLMGEKYCGWQFNHLTRLLFQVDFRKHARHADISAFVPHAYFSQLLHRHKIKVPEGEYDCKDCSLPLLHQKGVTNCSLGAISAKTNPKNVTAHIRNKHKSCDVIFGSGAVRHYENHRKDYNLEGSLANWTYIPKYEKKANGNQIIYEKFKIFAYNPSKSTLFSWINFRKQSEENIVVETSSTKPIIYQYKKLGVHKPLPHDYRKNYYLASVSRPDQPDESYDYTVRADGEGWLLSRKNWPNSRFLEIEYYQCGEQPGRLFKVPIQNYLDPRCNRVKCLKSPVGTDSTPIITHQFFYDLSFDINSPKKKVTSYHGITTVYDAYHRKSVYIYNANHRLDKLIRYLQNESYLITRYLWDDSSDNEKDSYHVRPYSSSNQGNLMGKIIEDGEGQVLSARLFEYDKNGNILKEKFYGNFTGSCQAVLKVDKNHRPIKNGIECYKRSFRYSCDDLNLLLEEIEPNGRSVRYTYKDQTDLLSSKFLSDNQRICVREFYEYDENNSIIKYVYDNGSGEKESDLTNVSERHITYYHPRKTIPVGLNERIDEMVLDIQSGKEKLLKRTIQTFSIEGRLLKQDVYNSEGIYCYSLEWKYDKHGNVTKEKNAIGQVIRRKFDENDNLIFEQGPCLDFYTLHTYDFSNRRIATERIHTNGEHVATHFTYDLVGNLVSQVDRYGNQTNYEYDDLNRLIATHRPSISKESPFITTKTTYDCIGNPIEEVDGRGFITKKSYNARGKVTSILYPDDQIERFEYYLDGKLAKKISSNGTETHDEVDCFGRVLSEKVYSNEKVLLSEIYHSYDNFHKTSSTDSSGLTTHFYYDEAGRISKTVCQDKIELYEYDLLGRLAKKKVFIDSDHMQIHCTEYDLLNRIIEERIEDEQEKIFKKVVYQYDQLGNRTHVIEETGAGLSQHITYYNADKKPIKIIDPEGNETQICYQTIRNELGQLVLQTMTTDPLGRQTSVIHNALEKPTKIILKDLFGVLLSQQEIIYDELGNVTHLFDHVIAEGKETRCIETEFNYQETNQISSFIQAKGLPEQQITHTRYNKFGQKERVTKPDGIVINFQYDALGRLESYASSNHSVSYKYTYDLSNQIVRVDDLIHNTYTALEYDDLGRLIKERLANQAQLSYSYDLLDRVKVLSLPDQSTVVYDYDAANLKRIQRWKDQQLLYTHEYQTFDRAGLNLKAISIDKQNLSFTYDCSKRLVNVESQPFKQTGTTYDRVGRLKQYQKQDPVGPSTIQYHYDDNDHLIEEEGHQKHSYRCDSLHNRLVKDQISYSSNGLHQLISSGDTTYEYDLAGNLTNKKNANGLTKYRYDANDRLISFKANHRVRYEYDAFHRRMTKTEGQRTIRYLYVGQDEIGSIDENNQIIELRILGQGHGAEIGASVAIELKGQIYCPSHDIHGNIICLADLEGKPVEIYRYTAFGEMTIFDATGRQMDTSAVGNPWRFSSKRYDEESGLVYFGRRYYDPQNGRWISADPIGMADGSNLYAYLHHHPTNGFDLYGLQTETGKEQGEPYYPLQNVDYHDKTPESKPIEDAAPNEAPLGFIEKKTGKKGKMFFCGMSQVAELGMGFVNGIMNSLKDAYKTAKSLSEMANDHYVTFVHNRSHGFVFDLIRCFFELYFYAETKAVKNLHKQWDAHFAFAGPNSYYYHECHSEGAIITRNALMKYNPELAKRIIVVAIAPAAYIDDCYAHSVTHYRSTRDVVPWFDFAGAYRCRHSTVVLDPHPDAPFFDHSIDSPTYKQVRRQNITNYCETYGVTACVQNG